MLLHYWLIDLLTHTFCQSIIGEEMMTMLCLRVERLVRWLEPHFASASCAVRFFTSGSRTQKIPIQEKSYRSRVALNCLSIGEQTGKWPSRDYHKQWGRFDNDLSIPNTIHRRYITGHVSVILKRVALSIHIGILYLDKSSFLLRILLSWKLEPTFVLPRVSLQWEQGFSTRPIASSFAAKQVIVIALHSAANGAIENNSGMINERIWYSHMLPDDLRIWTHTGSKINASCLTKDSIRPKPKGRHLWLPDTTLQLCDIGAGDISQVLEPH
jgi:hypothetical protein